MASINVNFVNKHGYELSGKMDFPLSQKPLAYAVFAHLFTGSKNLAATRHVSRSLTQNGIAVLRFDFTGLGDSEGSFAESTFTSNVDDLISACDFLRLNYEAPKIIVGHSLGGAASIFAASQVASVKAVATIGTPSEPKHVKHLLKSKIEEINATGVAKVNIGGQEFMIKKEFLDDLENNTMESILKSFRKAILILHSPQDTIVEIDNAASIYKNAFHPKSFVTLDGADHLLTNKDDAHYAGNVIASWVKRYIDIPHEKSLDSKGNVAARLGKEGYTTEIMAGRHGLLADESEDLGGADFGPSPYELLGASLAASTALTIQNYARNQKIPLNEALVHISYDTAYINDQFSKSVNLTHLRMTIELDGSLTDIQKQNLLEVSHECPIYKSLITSLHIDVTLTNAK